MMLCPECRDGKHQNCDGVGDWTDQDQPIPCSCDEGGQSEHPLR